MITFPGLNLWRGTTAPDRAVEMLSQQTQHDTHDGDRAHSAGTGSPSPGVRRQQKAFGRQGGLSP